MKGTRKIKTSGRTLLICSGLMCSSVVLADVKAAANDVCACLKAPYAKVEESLVLINKAQASNNQAQLLAAQSEIISVVRKSMECFQTLSSKYPKINQSETLREQVMQAADEQCPNPAAGLMGR